MWKYIKSNFNLAVLFGLAAAIFCVLIFFVNKGFADPDGYYHTRLASLLVHGQLADTFPWLPYMTWGRVFADQHYLYHLLLSPFVSLSALHWSVVVFSSFCVLVFAWLLRQYKINPWLWTLLFIFGSADFLFRITLVKANTLSLILLFLSLFVLERKKYLWLLPISFIFAWTYGGFVFLPAVIGVYVLVHLIARKQLLWQALFYGLLGIALGLLLHPQFPAILPHLYHQIFQTGLGAARQIAVGVEWYPYTFSGLVKTSWPILLVWLGSVVLVFKNYRKSQTTTEVSLLLISFSIFVLMLKSQRFVEYWAPFALLFSAVVLRNYTKAIDWSYVKQLFADHWQFKFSALIGLLLLGTMVWSTVEQTHNYYRTVKPERLYAQSAQWLVEHSRTGDIVFNPQWDQFPQLFYWNDHNYYIVGMDPTFMYLHDPDLYWQWRKVSDDNSTEWSEEELYRIIKMVFGSSYVFVEISRNPNLAAALDQAGNNNQKFQEVYKDEGIVLYRVN